ncbi:MAG: type I-B CRISPR-associated protein Cas7/Cst2/DevR [Candidatus Odinarchaeota archaeon]
MRHFVNIHFLLDIPAGALNMGETDPARNNLVLVKKLRTVNGIVPYISAQAFRYWLRETLRDKYSWHLSPTTAVSSRQAYTEADPVKYPDDDVFGYMRATKEDVPDKKGKTKKVDVTRTRVSPLKVSTLVGVGKAFITEDFGVMSRQTDGTPILHSHEFFTGLLQGHVSISTSDVGKFIITQKSGFQNLREEEAKANDKLAEKNGYYILKDKAERVKRVLDPVRALNYLAGGANLTLHLSDVTPKFIILCLHQGGNYLFGNIIDKDKKGVAFPSASYITEILEDYANNLTSNVYIGLRSGFLDDFRQDLEALDGKTIGNRKIIFNTPAETVTKFVEELEADTSWID